MDKQLLNLPKDIIFCKSCVVSNQRPRVTFDENGICDACNYANSKNFIIDWEKREKELSILLDKHRSKNGKYDVLVPGSGGKDSSYVANILKYKYDIVPIYLSRII